MRIAIMGSGGLGGYFRGMLARAGEDVHFISRGPHLEAMRSHGLTVKTSSIGEFTIPVDVTDDPSEIGTADRRKSFTKRLHSLPPLMLSLSEHAATASPTPPSLFDSN